MGWTELLLISLGVSVDAAAVSVGGSLCPGRYSKRHCAFNAALFFGGFQFLMPLVGFFAASTVAGSFSDYDHIAAFVLLALTGIKMIVESFKANDRNKCLAGKEFFAAKNMFLPATATSIDALAIGAGMAFSGNKIWTVAASMGIVTAMTSWMCVIIGKKLASSLPAARHLSFVGGVIIFLIGVKILIARQ